MYDRILVTLDGTPSDRAIIEHIKKLAKLAHSRLVLLHVADGWAARTYGSDAVSPEIAEDTAYLNRVREEFMSAGVPTMSTHGHRFLADMFLGTTASRVQHRISVPVLLLRAR
jgi:nucleotide-binding universal stress UspA family protein